MVMAYWLPNVPSYVWSIVFLILILGLNLFSVKGYGKMGHSFLLSIIYSKPSPPPPFFFLNR